LAEDTTEQAKERVGSVLDDKWTLERLLGVGGMAAVYAAKHRNGARAAVKVLHAELSRYKEVRERFVREGDAANRGEHPGAVKVLDDDVVVSGPESGTAYIVMELLEGESLQDRLERPPPMGELEFLFVADAVLEVLDAAHTRGVVHRDLKPENLFLVSSGSEDAGPASGGPRVKVLDFGLARLQEGQAITSYGLALGTPSFMSPEQAAGRIDEIDGRTDLFALAATGFRICTGRRIHEAPNPVDLVRKMASMAAPKVRAVRPQVSAALARVIDRALEFRREDRYETASAMREDVRRAISELEVSGPTQLAVPSPLAVPAPRAATRSSEPTVRPGSVSGAGSSDHATLLVESGDLVAPSNPFALLPNRTEESIHLPRRRSVLPWIALVGLGVLGTKLWMNHRASTTAEASATSEAPSAPASSAASAPLPAPAPTAQAPLVVRDRDASPEGAPGAKAAPASPSAVASGKAAPAPMPTTSGTHHGTPGKATQGPVHKTPHKHHGGKAHAAPAASGT
jgi:serine/threonine-protein kinase